MNHVNDTAVERETKAFTRQITALRESWILKGRPTDPNLYCCDYAKAEEDMKNGVSGDWREMGMYFCYPCLGFGAPREYEWEDKDEGEDTTVVESDEVKIEPLM